MRAVPSATPTATDASTPWSSARARIRWPGRWPTSVKAPTGSSATRFDFLNEQDVALAAAVRFVRADGQTVSTVATVPPRRSLGLDTTTVAGLGRPRVRHRRRGHAARAVGAHDDLAGGRRVPTAATPSRPSTRHATRWYFAEGATTQFELFFLLGNPSTRDTARVRVDYLRQDGPAVSRTVRRAAGLAPHHLGQSGARPRWRRARRHRHVRERRAGAGRARDVHTRRRDAVQRRSCRGR